MRGRINCSFLHSSAPADAGGEARATAMAEFYSKWEKEPLVLLKWFALQASGWVPVGHGLR